MNYVFHENESRGLGLIGGEKYSVHARASAQLLTIEVVLMFLI